MDRVKVMNLKLLVVIVVLVIALILFNQYRKAKEKKANHLALERLKSRQRQASQLAHLDTEAAKAISEHSNDAHNFMPDEFFNFTLCEQLGEKKRLMYASLENFCAPHPILLMLSKRITSNKELYRIIHSDPQLAAKIINVVNSAYYNLDKPISTLNHAINFLGVTMVKNIATQFVLDNHYNFKSDQQFDAYQRIWNASFLASALGLLLAAELNIDDAAGLSTKCLLHYLGDTAILSLEPDVAYVYQQRCSTFDRIKHIQGITDTNSAVVGELISKQWGLPSGIDKSLSISLHPMFDKLDDNLDAKTYRDTVLCYCICRIADSVIFEYKTDIFYRDVNEILDVQTTEFVHIKKQLNKAHLNQLVSLLKKPHILRSANELVEVTKNLPH